MLTFRENLATRCIAGCHEAAAPRAAGPLLSRSDNPWIFDKINFNLKMSCNVKLRKLRKNKFNVDKIGFSLFSQKVSILWHMLLHNHSSNINVAIAEIFPGRKSFYTLQELRFNYKP